MIDYLYQSGQIRETHVDEHARGHEHRSSYYDLDYSGLIRLIGELDPEQSSSMFDHLAEKYRTFIPSIFDMWPILNKNELGKFARQRLRALAREHLGYIKETADDFWDPDWFDWSEGTHGGGDNWVKMLRKDEVLRRTAAEVILRHTASDIYLRSGYLKALTGTELVVGTHEEHDRLTEEIEDLRLAVRMLQDASGLRVKMGEREAK